MSNSIAYEHPRQQPDAQPRPLWWPAAVAIAVLLVVAAGFAWGKATPALGERQLPPQRIWAAWCAAASLWSAAQAVLFGVALPAIYQARPAYVGLTALSSLVAVLAGISAAALWAAT